MAAAVAYAAPVIAALVPRRRGPPIGPLGSAATDVRLPGLLSAAPHARFLNGPFDLMDAAGITNKFLAAGSTTSRSRSRASMRAAPLAPLSPSPLATFMLRAPSWITRWEGRAR